MEQIKATKHHWSIAELAQVDLFATRTIRIDNHTMVMLGRDVAGMNEDCSGYYSVW
jgi:hypothetical protein